MPSWNEKPIIVPTINVNLKPCTCRNSMLVNGRVAHTNGCLATPVLIPCPLPGSFTCGVQLSDECTCPPANFEVMRRADGHAVSCSTRPVKVSCTVSGKTWEESEVMDSHLADGRDTTVREEDACRARWALVKALVLGKPLSEIPGIPRGALPLVEQRDAVFADLADTARAEAAALEAQQRAESRYPYHRFHRVGDGTHEGPRPSHARLAAYVEFLVEQVGVLR